MSSHDERYVEAKNLVNFCEILVTFSHNLFASTFTGLGLLKFPLLVIFANYFFEIVFFFSFEIFFSSHKNLAAPLYIIIWDFPLPDIMEISTYAIAGSASSKSSSSGTVMIAPAVTQNKNGIKAIIHAAKGELVRLTIPLTKRTTWSGILAVSISVSCAI